jgi:hypothetical protein
MPRLPDGGARPELEHDAVWLDRQGRDIKDLAARAVPSHRPRTGRAEPAGHGPGGQVRPAPAAEPAERELCPRGRGAQRLHAGRLGRHRGGQCYRRCTPSSRRMSWRPSACTATIPPCPCWPAARRSRRGCGPTCGTTGPLPDRRTTCRGVLLLARPHRRASQRHLASYAGILQADAYAGFGELYRAGRQPGPIREAACWAHFRRKVFELAEVARAPLAAEAVRRIDRVFDAERAVNGARPPIG